jgi:hypothetical protein
MKVPRLTVGIAAIVALAAVSVACGETFELELKRVDPTSSSITPIERMISSTSYQRFYARRGTQPGYSSSNEGEAEFAKIIKKEPAEYVCKSPFRGVAELGTQKFAFVFDTNPDAKDNERISDESKAEDLQRYSRLYFDLNCNGDLTDDTPIDAEPGTVYTTSSSAYARYAFPAVDVTVEADGSKMDYAFRISLYSRAYSSYSYTYASLYAAAYRTGEITVDGKKARVYLVDFNSNGRFDDLSGIDDSIMLSDGTAYPRQGDVIWVNPDPATVSYASPYDPTSTDAQQYVSKMLNVDGQFYDMEITPAGDKLTLSSSSKPVGYITNPNKGYRAVVYGDQGMMKISGDESGKSPLPVGKWRLLSYTLDGTKLDVAEEEEKPADEGPSLLESLANALTRSAPTTTRPQITLVAARGKRDTQAVEVREGETVAFPFGPPYKLKVAASPYSGGRASLRLSIVGVAGEVCNNMMVKGQRPPKPTFTITGPDGQEVASGNFEYG